MNLGSGDNRCFFGGVWVAILAREGRNRWNDREKWAVWSPTSDRAQVGWNAGSSKKTLKSDCSHVSPHNRPLLISWVLNYGGCYLSHFKSRRGGERLFTFQKRRHSLFTEKHIQLSILLYQPATIFETACILCIALFESRMAIRRDNAAKWWLKVVDLKLFLNHHTASDSCYCC